MYYYAINTSFLDYVNYMAFTRVLRPGNWVTGLLCNLEVRHLGRVTRFYIFGMCVDGGGMELGGHESEQNSKTSARVCARVYVLYANFCRRKKFNSTCRRK